MTPGENITAEGLAYIAKVLMWETCPFKLVCTRDFCCIHGKNGNAPWRDLKHRADARAFLNAVVWC